MTGFEDRRVPQAGLGEVLATARVRAGLGVRDAARRAGISASFWCNLEAGRRCPSTVVAERLAELLRLSGVEREVLLGAAVTGAGRNHPGRRAA